MIIFGPSYSLSCSTVLLTKGHKTDTKEKQISGGKKKETKCLAEGRYKLPELAWLSFCHTQGVLAWTEQARRLREVTGTAGEGRKTGKYRTKQARLMVTDNAGLLF